jgi:hypothetical protein
MAARKKGRRKKGGNRSKKGRARKKRGGSRKKRGASKRKKGGQIPLDVLEKRARKLNRVVKTRGGSV